jgi:DNA primase
MTAQAPHGMAAEARSVRLESEIARRGIKLSAGIAERCGPCPVCGGTNRFSINVNKQVWNCRGCSTGGDVIALVQHIDGGSFMEAVETLAGVAPATKSKARPAESASYDPRAAFEWAYQDESGAPLFRSVRTPEKQFWQSPADGHGGWVKAAKGCMEGVRLVPLYLPEVLAAIRNSGLILIAEGERKVDLLRHLGYAATCNVSGAIRSKLWIDHAKEFFSAGCYAPKIIVLPDKDEAGRKHADAIGAAFAAVGVTVHILELPGLDDKEDVINWYDRGGTREQLDDLIDSDARPWTSGERESVNAEPARPLRGGTRDGPGTTARL